MSVAIQSIKTKQLWSRWGLPETEKTGAPRIHRIGLASILVTVDSAGESPIIAVRSYLTASPGKSLKQAPEPIPPQDDPSWMRAFLGDASGYDLLPAYDDKPVCVQLLEPFTLPPGASARGWIFTNTNAEIHVEGQNIIHIPLKPVFKTLYGTPSGGIVCIFAKSGFLAADDLDYTSIHDDPSTVAHPVRIKNNSDLAVVIHELCVYGEQLSIFRRGERLQSETLIFSFSGSGVRMNIESPGKLPQDTEILVRPRISSEEKAFERSVELFKAITRMR